MPVNKAAYSRFEIIDECLRNDKRKWSKSDLLSFINRRLELVYGEGTKISVSQLRYDIEDMKVEYDAPISMYKEGRSFYYRYDDINFSIKNLPILNEDILKLKTAVDILRQIKGFPIAEEISDIVYRLENRSNQTCEFQNNIQFESVPNIKGIEYLEDIYYALIRKNVLKLEYKTFLSDKPKGYIVHPYLLKEFDNRWYILGYCEEKQSVTTYALDRIIQIKVVNIPYVEQSNSLEHYFDDLIGITKPLNAVPEIIDLMFTKHMAPYILTKPIHQSQETIRQYKHGFIQVRLTVIINPELIGLLLSFGKEVRVLGPDNLIDKVYEMAKQIVEIY